jgi:extradiol dioxygenase family protein
MRVIGFSHYNLRAPRPLLEALRAFYCDVVGLSVGPRPPFRSFGHWLYAGEQAVLHLSESAPREDSGAAVNTTFDHAAFSCSGLVGYERKLTQRGIQYRVARVPETGQTQLFFKDPAGNGVELNFDNAGD